MNPETGPQFLKQKYDLDNSQEVEKAAKRTEHRTDEKVAQNPNDRIQNYLDRLENIINPPKLEDHEKFDRKERNIAMLKSALFDKYITKPEDISQNYTQFLEEVIEERGQRGDWEAASDEEKQRLIAEQSEAALADQKDSLEIWVDYLASDDAIYPDWLKYWAFRSILHLSEYNKEQKKFPKRSRGTVKMFPDLNHEALAYVLDAIEKKYQGQSPDFPYDIQEDERARFGQFLKGENFANLYAWAIENINPIDEELLKVTDGKWIKYERGSDHSSLVESIRGKGTGWCTAGEMTAARQLESGDFHVFYSNDSKNNPTIPRIAIRMENENIAEVRGIAEKQNLDPYVNEALAKKLQEFPDKDVYLKKEHDMAHLTEIKNKARAGEKLNKDDLVFLYEIDEKIQGFGYTQDPRIAELRNGRDPKVDALILFSCEPEEIAWGQQEISENTKAYVGPLFKGIFKLGQIEHLYTSFPEGKIRREELTIGGKTEKELEAEMHEKKINISDYALDMLHSKEFTTLKNHEELTTIRLKVKEFDFDRNPTTDQLYAKAQEFGLDICPAEVGPYKRLKDLNQPLDEWYRIAMKQITDRYGHPSVFNLGRYDDGLWLYYSWTRPDDEWCPGFGIVFCLRKVS